MIKVQQSGTKMNQGEQKAAKMSKKRRWTGKLQILPGQGRGVAGF
jgi:hypothetical protein